MTANVVLPNLGFGMEEGRLIAWLKKPGETVKKGEPIAEIESDKATVELEAVVDGTLVETLFPPDSVVPVLARIGTGDEVRQPSIPASFPHDMGEREAPTVASALPSHGRGVRGEG